MPTRHPLTATFSISPAVSGTISISPAVTGTISISPAVTGTFAIVVRTASELREALSQHEKPVTIDNAELERKFSRLQFWQGREGTLRFFAVLLAGILALSIALGYRIDVNWTRDWKLDRLDGKITLTPSVKP